MAKYHLSDKTGKPAQCKAFTRPCPVGGDHFESKEEAQAASEALSAEISSAAEVKKGDSVKMTVQSREIGATVVRTRGAEGAILATPDGMQWKARRTVGGWVGTDRVQNPARHAIPTAESLEKDLEVPPGFTLTREPRTYWDDGAILEVLTLESPGGAERIEIVMEDDGYSLGSGHVTFSSSKGKRSFDQRGVGDSFYVDNPATSYRDEGDPVSNLNKTIREFVEVKIPQARARIDNATRLPNTSVLVSAKAKEKLIAGELVSVRPAGFGTGYMLSSKPFTHARQGSKEQAEACGLKQVWISSFDAD